MVSSRTGAIADLSSSADSGMDWQSGKHFYGPSLDGNRYFASHCWTSQQWRPGGADRQGGR
jgi:hypothetical protein